MFSMTLHLKGKIFLDSKNLKYIQCPKNRDMPE